MHAGSAGSILVERCVMTVEATRGPPPEFRPGIYSRRIRREPANEPSSVEELESWIDSGLLLVRQPHEERKHSTGHR